MGTHRRQRITVAVTILDLRPTQRVRVVTGPYLRKITKNAQVEPIAAGAAALKQDFRKTLCKFLHTAVQTAHIPVAYLPLRAGSQTFRIDIREDTVHIPFYIRNICGREHPAHLFNDIVLHRRIRQIQNPLVTPLGMSLSRNIHSPLRMGPVQTALHIHHLRLHPDTEGKPKRLHFIAQSFQTTGQLLIVYFPVPQRAAVVGALPEPPVVHHKKLNARILTGLRQPQQLPLIDREICRLPAV